MPAPSRLCLPALITALVASVMGSASQIAPPASTTATSKQPDTPAKPHHPRPNPDASGKYHVGDGVTTPILIHSVEPEFANKIQSTPQRCVVALTVGVDGKASDVHVLPSANESNGDPAIETQMLCVDAVKSYRFKPATFQGKPVAVDLKVEINFHKPQSF